MKILIIGASGLVGNALYHQFKIKGHDVIGTYNRYKIDPFISFDITNDREVEKTIKEISPDVILNPAAYAYVDGCEENPDLCRRINVGGVSNVIKTIQGTKTKFVFFSTDYIFDGENGPYKEEDTPNPINLYGKLKLEMEEYIKSHLDRYLIIRTANVFGWEKQGKNFVVKLIHNLKKGQEMEIVNDQKGNPTYAPQLSEAIYILLSEEKQGIYHVAGKSVIDRYSFSKEIADVFNLNPLLLKPVTTRELGQKVKRPLNGGLIVEKVQKELPFTLYSSYEALCKMKQNGAV